MWRFHNFSTSYAIYKAGLSESGLCCHLLAGENNEKKKTHKTYIKEILVFKGIKKHRKNIKSIFEDAKDDKKYWDSERSNNSQAKKGERKEKEIKKNKIRKQKKLY